MHTMREILRLLDEELSQHQIATSRVILGTTVGDYVM
jgi:hypothetical protein